MVSRRRRVRPAGDPRRADRGALRRARARRLGDRRPAQMASCAGRRRGDVRARPFDPAPRVHAGIRRLPGGRVRRPRARAVSLDDMGIPTRTSVSSCRRRRGGRRLEHPARARPRRRGECRVDATTTSRDSSPGACARAIASNCSAEPVLSICCLRYRDAEGVAPALERLNARSSVRLVQETPYLPSSTVVGALRDSPVLHQRTDRAGARRRVLRRRGGIGDELKRSTPDAHALA